MVAKGIALLAVLPLLSLCADSALAKEKKTKKDLYKAEIASAVDLNSAEVSAEQRAVILEAALARCFDGGESLYRSYHKRFVIEVEVVANSDGDINCSANRVMRRSQIR